ncbi:PREDICTED: piggyBac transposable element-derived protein 4-like [Habropoda laboriosa]|uniref:piggyBac transposable element-derived protein 4-like n=1 Tax=Habropoda laboriosa TaxID=597456 RepID=UPI00083E5908|nr:PREDICTED: piggyBac transposable element-derived protein 4-like [Habropoda laboriosa]
MGQVKKSNIQLYWTRRGVLETPIFRQTMPFKRFRQISRFLHFSDNETDNSKDRLRKIRPVINFWNQKFKEIYTPSEYVSIDESLMKYKGRLAYKQFNPSKRARFGIKIYKLCEASTGFCHQFKIYTGQDKIDRNDSASENVTIELSKSIINKGYTLFLDNWYSSPNLFLKLHQRKTNVIGTVRKNRKNMPQDLQKHILKKGEFMWRSCNNLIALRWKDKRDVYMLSTKHKTIEMVEESNKQLQKVMKPKCIVEYNKGMGGVDRQDQALACFPIMRKAMKGYRKLFFYISDMALFNTYIMQKTIYSRKRETYVDYRVNIAEAILQIVKLPDYKMRGKSSVETPLRLQARYWAHFPKNIDPTPRNKHPTRMCKVCYKQKIRSATKWECAKCKVALHLPKCFEKYHTMEDF